MILVSESGLGRVTAVRADSGPAAQQREGAAALMTESDHETQLDIASRGLK